MTAKLCIARRKRSVALGGTPHRASSPLRSALVIARMSSIVSGAAPRLSKEGQSVVRGVRRKRSVAFMTCCMPET